MPSASPVVSRRRMLVGTAALAALGITAGACGESPPPPELADLVGQRDQARSDSQLATDAAAAAKPDVARALNTVATERSDHAGALSDEIARLTGKPTSSTTTTTTTGTSPAKAPTAKDVVDALKKSADSAGQLATNMSGYRAGLLGSIAASCTAAYTVALGPGGGAS